MAKTETGDWKLYRTRFGLTPNDEVDLHFGRRERGVSYYDAMSDVEVLIKNTLRRAQENGRAHVMFVHGWSTSGPGKTTARSVVRGFMRSKEATPLIERAQCIQHETVFVAKIKQHAASATAA